MLKSFCGVPYLHEHLTIRTHEYLDMTNEYFSRFIVMNFKPSACRPVAGICLVAHAWLLEIYFVHDVCLLQDY